MTTDKTATGKALKQFVQTDQFWNVNEVPVSTEALAAQTGRPAPAAAARKSGPTREQVEQLEALDEQHVKTCQKCGLHTTRNHTVFGAGNANARLVFVGEGPGAEEDRQGIPFVGRAGQLLTKMIAAMGLTRDDVYITNIVKCRPPNNRDPASEEIVACSPYLMEQLRIIDPEVIVALGAPASKTLLQTSAPIGRLRGQYHEFKLGDFMTDAQTIPLMPTFHPAYLLRSPDQKKKAWDDLQQVMALLNLPIPGRRT